MHRPLSRRAVTALAATLFALAIAATPAHATPIPLGDYPCSYYAGANYTSAGTVNIVGPGTYRINSGVDGSYTHDSATNIVTFATGDYESFYGVWDPSRPASIEIHDKSDGAYLWACNYSTGSEANYPQGGSPPPPTGGGGDGGGGGGDTTAPEGSVRLTGSTRLATAISHGLTESVTCGEACTIASTAVISSRDARRLGLARSSGRSVVVGRGSGSLDAAGTKSVKVRFTRSAKRRLRRANRVTVTVRTKITDAAGNAQTITKRVRLRR